MISFENLFCVIELTRSADQERVHANKEETLEKNCIYLFTLCSR